MRHLTLLTAALVIGASTVTPVVALAKTDISIGMQQEPTSLDPTADATASIDGMLAHNVFESLTTVAEDGSVLPDLATDWTISDDGLTYTFTLADGVTFHDGTTFDADDVKFTFDRAMSEESTNPSESIFAPITDVTVVDPLTVEMTLERKDAFFLFNIAQGDASIIAPESVETLATHPVGTGPFAFDSWTRGDRLVLTKYDGYRNADDVALTSVSFRFISDPAAASAALLSGELDAFPGFPAPELLVQFEADPRFNVVVGSTQGEVILAMNNARAPFTDLTVRQAISHALDRTEIIDGAMYGMAEPIGSFYPPGDKSYIDLTGTYPHDVEKAKELLAKAGIAEGTEMSLRVPPFPYATRSAEIIQSELSKVGLNVKVENVEWGFWLDEIYANHNYDMTIIAHTSPNDMDNFARGKDYFYGYEDPAFTDLWHRIETETDPVARDALVKEAQKFLADAAIHGYLFEMPKLGVYVKQLDGFWASQPVLFQPLAGITWTD